MKAADAVRETSARELAQGMIDQAREDEDQRIRDRRDKADKKLNPTAEAVVQSADVRVARIVDRGRIAKDTSGLN